ncbi:ubiquitin carboxyl-terminal hydrolase 21-like [Zingiber officinale]|uniref:ubiquitin carboxyl-terminal hydrolase 21-like n=1 Tax=Zingiber officinale TaxID=94328 RepID=UPI001C4CA76C|nr:ubiquitin carboxyl-terminal hydrolase 21-like [Zingiber officinale]
MAVDPLLSVDPQVAALDPVVGPSSCTSPSPLNDRPRFVGAGLKNLGNTCFLNAVLQCLTHTVPFVQKILKTDHSPCFRAADGDFCSFCAFKQHVSSCLLLSGYVTSPVKFAENLSQISPHFQLGQQEDAHEFLQSLLDSIHSCCLGNKSDDWKSSLDKDSFVTQVFGGCLRSQLRCCGCGHLSDTFEPLLDLSLEIDNAESVVDALTSFTRLEKIDDSEIKLICEGCKSQVTMEKQLKLKTAPEVLALHLKRFKNDGNTCYKIYDSVNFPLELDLSSFLSCPIDEVQFKYDLSSVLVHIGSPYSGHYYCFVRSSPSTWYQIDDRKVTRVAEEYVLEQEAYVLFYVKQGTSCWFSSFLERERKHIDDTSDTSPISVLDHLERYHSSPTNSEGSCSSSRESPAEQAEIPSVKPQDKILESKTNGAENSVSDDNRPPLRSAAWSIPVQDLDVLFEDEIKEDEKDDSPPAEELKAAANKENQPVLESTNDDTQANKAFNRLVRGMPKSRRSGILACLTSQHGSFRKRSLNLGDSSGSKRTKVHGVHDDGSQQKSRTMSQSLSPRSIRRGLFIEGSNMS